MRWILLGLAATTRAAVADPATPEQFEACKARRHELAIEAMKVPDPDARAARYAAMPECVRNADGTFAVNVPPPPRPIDTTPFAPHVVLAARFGASASAFLANEIQPGGFGPYIELHAGYHARRRVELAVAAAFSSFHDGSAFDIRIARSLDVQELSFELAARMVVHYPRFGFGLGAGVDVQQFANTEAIGVRVEYAHAAPLVEAHATYAFAHSRNIEAEVFARATAVAGTVVKDDPAVSTQGTLVSGRLGVGVSY